MDLRIHSIQNGGETIVFAEGRIVLGEASNFLRDSFRGLIEQGHVRITLNLKGVPYIDSGGLGELVGCFTALTRRGGRLKLLDPTPRVAKLLSLTRLDEIMEIMQAEAPIGSQNQEAFPGVTMGRTAPLAQPAAR